MGAEPYSADDTRPTRAETDADQWHRAWDDDDHVGRHGPWRRRGLHRLGIPPVTHPSTSAWTVPDAHRGQPLRRIWRHRGSPSRPSSTCVRHGSSSSTRPRPGARPPLAGRPQLRRRDDRRLVHGSARGHHHRRIPLPGPEPRGQTRWHDRGHPLQPVVQMRGQSMSSDPDSSWGERPRAFSAPADSALEPCPGCVGDGDDGPVLRALGRVLGTTDLGYDCRWYGLRAADVDAAHGRFRVFLFATPADSGRLSGATARQDRPGGRSSPCHGDTRASDNSRAAAADRLAPRTAPKDAPQPAWGRPATSAPSAVTLCRRPP